MSIEILPIPQRENGSLTVVKASSIKPKPVRWLWKHRIPIGQISLIAGKADLGKSQSTVWLTAQVSNGKLEGHYERTPKGVLYLATEDDWSFTIRPRLEAAGADLDRVYFLATKEKPAATYKLNVVTDLDELKRIIKEQDIALVVFDPLVSVFKGRKWNDSGEVREQLDPIVEMLTELNCAFVGIMHFRKEFGPEILDQIAGSGAWGQVVRAVIAMVRDPDSEDEKRVIVSQAKSNLGPGNLPSLTYTFEPHSYMSDDHEFIETCRIVFGEESAWSASEILNGQNTEKAKNLVYDAGAWLTGYLLNGKAEWIEDVVKAGKEQGYSESTLRRAKAMDSRIKKVSVEGTKAMKWQLDTP